MNQVANGSNPNMLAFLYWLLFAGRMDRHRTNAEGPVRTKIKGKWSSDHFKNISLSKLKPAVCLGMVDAW
jgi:hypothetical protein